MLSIKHIQQHPIRLHARACRQAYKRVFPPTNKSSVRRFSVLLQIDAQIVEFLVALLIAASFELLRRSFDGKCASAEDNTDDHRIDAKYLEGMVGGGVVGKVVREVGPKW